VTTFFDTSVLVYAFDPRDARKQRVALDLIRAHVEDGDFTISTQVLQEFCAVVLRRRLLDADLAMEAAARFAEDCRATSPQGVLRGVALAQRHQLSIWDGLIVQAALDAGCTTLLSEDLGHGQRFGALQVVDPFRLAVQERSPASRRRRRR
jgi:predicted nucleic acid-binding protein